MHYGNTEAIIVWQTWMWILVLSLTSFVALGRLFHFWDCFLICDMWWWVSMYIKPSPPPINKTVLCKILNPQYSAWPTHCWDSFLLSFFCFFFERILLAVIHVKLQSYITNQLRHWNLRLWQSGHYSEKYLKLKKNVSLWFFKVYHWLISVHVLPPLPSPFLSLCLKEN